MIAAMARAPRRRDPSDRVIDPRGWTVLLKDERWHSHVLARHPDMAGLRDRVADTIREPRFIFESERSVMRFLYFAPIDRELWIEVVVLQTSEDRGMVLTAHKTRRLPAWEPIYDAPEF